MLCMADHPVPPCRKSAVRLGLVRPTERAIAKPHYSCSTVVTQYTHLSVCALLWSGLPPREEISARQFCNNVESLGT